MVRLVGRDFPFGKPVWPEKFGVASCGEKLWIEASADPPAAASLAHRLNIPVPVALALTARGITNPEEAEAFLNPRLSSLGDPFRIPGMREAVDRIRRAIKRGEKIVVFGDYDADGVTATALMVSVLRRLGGVVVPFVPDRFEHGYGLSSKAVTECLVGVQPDLLVTVDCGTNSSDSIALVRKAEVDVVVTDHHEGLNRATNAVAVVNPSVAGCDATRYLTGVGVAFKVCHALLKDALEVGDLSARGMDLRTYLDLVAIGTVADVAVLRGENRVLVRHGLSRLNCLGGAERRIGLQALLEEAGYDKRLDTYQLGFLIGPRLNAAGRVGSPDDALNLLLAEDHDTAHRFAVKLENANSLRREIEEHILTHSIRQIDGWFDENRHYGIVAVGDGWHTGTLGIVAGRLCAQYRRPAVVVSRGEDGLCRGSARSIETFDILGALKACAELLEDFGGHAMAAGVTLEQRKLDDFCSQFNRVCAAKLAGQNLAAKQTIDAWISLDEVNLELYEYLERMSPFGMGNPAPTWGTKRVQVIGPPKVLKAVSYTHL
ncbi:MAG: single-stranded-DNA-specific exonuclease RecJ, partial [Kiritimatiellae bacterium]|nr:single-stranded-DNA-specific exonuclease RecJ [Kiritimatiellia bacterium]